MDDEVGRGACRCSSLWGKRVKRGAARGGHLWRRAFLLDAEMQMFLCPLRKNGLLSVREGLLVRLGWVSEGTARAEAAGTGTGTLRR